MPTYRPIKLDTMYLETTLGTCQLWCGRESTLLAGTIRGEDLCAGCYEESKTRRYAIYMYGGEDILVTVETLEDAMREIADYLEHPDEYARYAPYVIQAENDTFNLQDHVATIQVAKDAVARSRSIHGGYT